MNAEHVWNKVLTARNPKRPTAKKLIEFLIDDFIELKGDRLFSDDTSMLCGIGFLNDMPITVIAQEKGETTPEKIKYNFGMPHPEGYRKALRLMKQAEKFNRPILFIIDTPGAFPGIGAEERGQAAAIAENLFTMIDLKTQMIAVVLGEGGSGGALAIGVSDEIWMFENAIYSILSPEGFASILYKDASLAKESAAVMKLTAEDLFNYQIIDRIIPEFNGGLHIEPQKSFQYLKNQLISKYQALKEIDVNKLCEKRYQKYRNIGIYGKL
ncbi:MAG TPA: acetyl-CoA carboxylase carboxyltransferase subunit alpha [Acholeplasmataceae bacterium]|jgi:acetyl-CoA carboxylase carboxyl transferase subunit alpha|nr:acetyl-CoA carboxylase carboxyltransferase subunit alpha [Acholeplasmataceae bacterium]